MNVPDATKLCADHGALLVQYQSPRVAMLMLPSAEPLLISIETIPSDPQPVAQGQ